MMLIMTVDQGGEVEDEKNARNMEMCKAAHWRQDDLCPASCQKILRGIKEIRRIDQINQVFCTSFVFC